MRQQDNTNDISKVIRQGNIIKVEPLISDLGSKDKSIRIKAHQSLVATGEPAVQSLVEAMANPNERLSSEAGKVLDEINTDWTEHADERIIAALISDLESPAGFIRIRARQFLVLIGKKATSLLVKALENKKGITKWEAAKALEQIGDPLAIEALIKILEDETFEIRWLAAEGLIAIGIQAVVPLLHKLIQDPESEWLHEGAHHILYSIKNVDFRSVLRPVTHALEAPEASLEVPLAAKNAIKALEEKTP